MAMLQIKPEEAHIWWANLRDFDSDMPALQTLLSLSEQKRAERFRFLRDSKNYILSHGILRILLGRYFERPAPELNFISGDHGKPELRRNPHEREIYFNLSHSGDLALYGITVACPIGVDVEHLRFVPDLEQIALEWFSQSDAADLRALSGERQTRHFFHLWTRKEALLKATGGGLSNEQTVRYACPTEPKGVQPANDSGLPEWGLHSFSPAPGYLAAVALKRSKLSLTCSCIRNAFMKAGYDGP